MHFKHFKHFKIWAWSSTEWAKRDFSLRTYKVFPFINKKELQAILEKKITLEFPKLAFFDDDGWFLSYCLENLYFNSKLEVLAQPSYQFIVDGLLDWISGENWSIILSNKSDVNTDSLKFFAKALRSYT